MAATKHPFEPIPTKAFSLARKLVVFIGGKSQTLNQLYDCLNGRGPVTLDDFKAELGKQLNRLD